MSDPTHESKLPWRSGDAARFPAEADTNDAHPDSAPPNGGEDAAIASHIGSANTG